MRVALVNMASIISDTGIAFVSSDVTECEAVLISIHAAIPFALNRTVVYLWGASNERFESACNAMEAVVFQMGDLPARREFEQLVRSAAGTSPFLRTLFLPAASLVIRSPDQLFHQDSGPVTESNSPILSIRSGMDAPEFRLCSEGIRTANHDISSETAVICFDGSPELWCQSAYAEWCAAEVEAAKRLGVRVQVSRRAGVTILVDQRNMGDFERRWLWWNVGASVHVQIALLGLRPEQVWLAKGPDQPVTIIELARQFTSSQLFDAITRYVRTDAVIFIPADAIALPGAELFVDDSWNSSAAVIHSPESIERPALDSEAMALSLPFFAMISTEVLRKIASECKLPADSDAVAQNIGSSLLERRIPFQYCDMKRYGWAVSERLAFVETDDLEASTQQSR